MISATPARQGQATMPDGRRVSHAEFGDLDGRPAILFHGNPGSRLACPDLEATMAAGIRLITFDRPGFGGSDPFPFHTLGDVADDVAHLGRALGLGPCPMIGWSGGGPYALAVAARHPDLCTRVIVVSGSGLADDPDLAAARTDEVEDLIDRLRRRSPDALRTVEDKFSFYADDPTAIITMTVDNDDDPDQRLMRLPEVASSLATMWREGARQGAAGVAAGWTALWALPRGFEPEQVSQPTTVWHGTSDVVVSFAEAERHAAALPSATFHAVPDEGHLIALEHWAMITGEV